MPEGKYILFGDWCVVFALTGSIKGGPGVHYVQQ